jgi:opacity protein-like surface antigen
LQNNCKFKHFASARVFLSELARRLPFVVSEIGSMRTKFIAIADRNLNSKGRIHNMRRTASIIAGIAILLSVGAGAQEIRSEISLQGTGFFTKDSTGQGTTQRGTDTGGFLVGYRYHFNRWLAAETVYGYGRNSQEYFSTAGFSRVQANVHQATGGFVFSLPRSPRLRLSPYLLAEGGALVFDPTNNAFGSVLGAQRQAVGVFSYGGGVDYPVVKYLSIRAEYRGLVYNAPDFGMSSLKTDSITHTAQPSAGIVLRF